MPGRWAAAGGAPIESIEAARREFAEKIRGLAALRSDGLVRALASVPREEFVGPGPWQIIRPSEFGRGYVATPNADPRHLYDNVLVALDPSRHLNNGEPAALARWLDSLALVAGDRLLHIGCGVGYYTAIAAEALKPGGSVVGVELDRELAARARQNLRRWQNVTVVSGDGGHRQAGAFDAIFVNAGATEPISWWLDGLRIEGRLLLPLTVDYPLENHGAGHMLLVVRHAEGYSARFVSPVGIYHCAGARTDEGNDLLKRAYLKGGHDGVRRLRREEHPRDAQCWLHAPGFCLSRVAVEA
jgi:protein-L-isoaspartate(D-aspartate) O-methyltransferase